MTPPIDKGVCVPRSLAERTEAMFRSVDPSGAIAQEWADALTRAPDLMDDARLGQECEALIALKAHQFNGEPPYVGNEGVLLALRESLDELNRLKSFAPSSRAALIHEQDCPKVWDFYKRYALGSKVCPSCLMCGHQAPDRDDWAITHGDLPDIYICKGCVVAARRADGGGAPVPAKDLGT